MKTKIQLILPILLFGLMVSCNKINKIQRNSCHVPSNGYEKFQLILNDTFDLSTDYVNIMEEPSGKSTMYSDTYLDSEEIAEIVENLSIPNIESAEQVLLFFDSEADAEYTKEEIYGVSILTRENDGYLHHKFFESKSGGWNEDKSQRFYSKVKVTTPQTYNSIMMIDVLNYNIIKVVSIRDRIQLTQPREKDMGNLKEVASKMETKLDTLVSRRKGSDGGS